MPAYHFLYEKRRIGGERAADALTLGEEDKLPEGWEVVPTYDAKCLVAYLMSLDQSHPLNELKATAAAPHRRRHFTRGLRPRPQRPHRRRRRNERELARSRTQGPSGDGLR